MACPITQDGHKKVLNKNKWPYAGYSRQVAKQVDT